MTPFLVAYILNQLRHAVILLVGTGPVGPSQDEFIFDAAGASEEPAAVGPRLPWDDQVATELPQERPYHIPWDNTPPDYEQS